MGSGIAGGRMELMESIRLVFWVGLATGAGCMLLIGLHLLLQEKQQSPGNEVSLVIAAVVVMFLECAGVLLKMGWIALATLLGSLFLGMMAMLLAMLAWALASDLLFSNRDSRIPT